MVEWREVLQLLAIMVGVMVAELVCGYIFVDGLGCGWGLLLLAWVNLQAWIVLQ